MALGYYSFTVGERCDGSTLRTYLRHECGLSARSMTVLKATGMGITRNGIELRAHDTVRTGDRIELTLPRDKSEIQPVEGALDILFEDDHLLLVNKPAGVPVHPTKVHQTDTLANIAAFYQHEKGEEYTFRALNRLDKDTSGCVLIAKDRIAYTLVQPTVTKRYVAVCEGELKESGTVDLPIGLQDDSKIVRCIRDDGARAVTHYRPLSYHNNHTLVELSLETGRTHQIRCHMSAIGHPLAGDDLYGGSLKYLQRQALHCRTISFMHPVTKERLDFDTGTPSAFLAILNQ